MAQELYGPCSRSRGLGRHRSALPRSSGDRQADPGARREAYAFQYEPADPDEHSGIGKSRVLQAKKTIREVNPDVDVEVFDERITARNVQELLRTARIALSARPNFEERRILNRACIEKGIPMVEAAMNGTEGYLFNVIPKVASCVHCVYPEDDLSWEELGFPVIGAVSGMLGCMMALEAIKLLTGYGKPLFSEMLVFNTLDMDFRKVKVPRNEQCEVCGSG